MHISWVASGNSCTDRLCDNSEAAWSISPCEEKRRLWLQFKWKKKNKNARLKKPLLHLQECLSKPDANKSGKPAHGLTEQLSTFQQFLEKSNGTTVILYISFLNFSPSVKGRSLIKQNYRLALQMWAGAVPGGQEALGGGGGG